MTATTNMQDFRAELQAIIALVRVALLMIEDDPIGARRTRGEILRQVRRAANIPTGPVPGEFGG